MPKQQHFMDCQMGLDNSGTSPFRDAPRSRRRPSNRRMNHNPHLQQDQSRDDSGGGTPWPRAPQPTDCGSVSDPSMNFSETFLDLIPMPPGPNDPEFADFVQEVEDGIGFWGTWRDNTDCLQIIIIDGLRSPISIIPSIFSGIFDPIVATFQETNARPYALDRRMFWIIYTGDNLSLEERLEFARPLWDTMAVCDPPPVHRHDDCFLIEPEALDDRSSIKYRFLNPRLMCDIAGNPLDIYELAIRVISDNFDIIEWLSCVLNPNLSECLKAYLINDDRKDLYIQGGSSSANALEEGDDCRIRFNKVNFCNEYIEEFDSASTPEDKMCILAQLASRILHESVHCCVSETGFRDRTVLGDGRQTCSNAYMIQSSFMWCLTHRYPNLLQGGCSAWASDDRLFDDFLA